MIRIWRIALAITLLALFLPSIKANGAGSVYYVSPDGNDQNPGTDPAAPLKSLNKVNQLALNPGDQVLFACGQQWRGEMLNISRSGTTGNPIIFSSYPSGCPNKPMLKGTQPVSIWIPHTGNIYVADLNAGANAGLFPNGINQLFRDGARLTMGRWPNLDAGDGGYSTVDSQPAANQLTDAQLPGGNWAGATLHLKVIRWSMINRDIQAQNGQTLTLNTGAGCWTGNCSGWGYFINNSLNTLDQEGEWYFDKTARKVYLYTQQNPNTSLIEASVIFKTNDRNWGAINLGTDLASPVHHVIVDNFEIHGWFASGIVSPTNLHPDENSDLIIRNNTIRDVEDTGINLWSWVWDASDGLDGWRGGSRITLQNNRIDGANHFGIHTPSRLTTIENNTIRNIGLTRNLNESGLGCGKTGTEGSCTAGGTGLRIYVDDPARSGYGFSVRYNAFENIGYHGIQTFGSDSLFSNNFFEYTCITKGDGGAINTFGSGNLDSSNVHDIQILNNLILNTIGNTDGTATEFREPFGFGIYLDHGSRDIITRGNLVAYSSASGILYQNSTGIIENNTVFRNVTGNLWANQIDLTSSPSQVSSFIGNTMVSAGNRSWNLNLDNTHQIGAADYNLYFHTAQPERQVKLKGQSLNLGQWKSTSGKDVNARAGTVDTSLALSLYVNKTDTAKTISTNNEFYFATPGGVPLGRSIVLGPYSGRVLTFSSEPGNQVFLPAIRR